MKLFDFSSVSYVLCRISCLWVTCVVKQCNAGVLSSYLTDTACVYIPVIFKLSLHEGTLRHHLYEGRQLSQQYLRPC